MKFLALINFTASVHGFFLSFLLINRRGASKEHRVLALLIFVMSATLIGPVLGLSGYYKELPHLIRVSEPLALLFGPFLYFYISLLSENKLPKGYLWHLLPFVLFTLYISPFYLLTGQEKIVIVDTQLMNNVPNIPMHLVRISQVGIYIILSLGRVKKLEQKLKSNFSQIDQFNLQSSSFVLKLSLILLLIGFGVYLLSLVRPMNFLLINNLTSLGISLLIYALAYFNWNQSVSMIHSVIEAPEPYQIQKVNSNTIQNPLPEKGRTNFYLSEEQYKKLSLRLEGLLLDKDVYLNPDISLSQLSEKLNILPYQTSELISRKYQQSFFDLINQHRIEEVKKRLVDPEFNHFSILAIAMDCGFNSKSSFNTAFKKFTGLTPSEFKRNQPA